MTQQFHGMGDPGIPCIHYYPLPYIEYRTKKTKTFCTRTSLFQAPDLPHTVQTYFCRLLLKPQRIAPPASKSPNFPPTGANSRGSPGEEFGFFQFSSISVGLLHATRQVPATKLCGQRCSLGETSLYMPMSLV
jgi:hypothetical protein